MTERTGRLLPGALLAIGIVLQAADAGAQQPAPGGPPPTTEQLRQAIEEIKKRLQRPSEAQPPAEQALSAELRTANARIAELVDTLGKLRGERDRLLAEAESARAESQRLGQVVGELEARAQALEQRMAELAEGRTREVERLQAELESARRRAAEAAELAGSGAERVRGLEAELERLRGELGARERALAEARNRAEAADRRRVEREAELAGLVNRLGELQAELEANRGRARTEAEAQARRIEELTGRLQAADAAVARLESEVLELRSIAATSVGELQNLGEQLLRVLADNQALVQTVDQVRTARELAVAEAAAARRDAELYAAEAARLRSQLAAAAPQAIAPAAGPPARAEPPADGLLAPEPVAEPLPRAQLAELRAVENPDGTVVTVIEGSAFQFGSEQLTEAANGALLRVGRLIDLVKPERVRFVGHTDSQGDEGANRRLSQRRAQAVRDWLVRNRGLEAARTRVEGRGPDQPIASNDTPEGRRANRRVEVILERSGVAR